MCMCIFGFFDCFCTTENEQPHAPGVGADGSADSPFRPEDEEDNENVEAEV